ncbi:MAG: preprotein translocase subunit SecG [Acidobacteriota bacterium]|jgi:preprotein translocase subunit SecG
MLATILTLLHVMVCLFLIFVVLLQSGQAADLAGAFGGGGSQTALGMRGAATLLQKLTTWSAIVFMLTSLSLGIVGRSDRSVIDDVSAPAGGLPAPSTQAAPPTTLPATPSTGAATPTTLPAATPSTEAATPTTLPSPEGGSGQPGGQGGGR